MAYSPSYQNHDQLQEQLAQWQSEYPGLLSVGSIGTSPAGRPVPLATVTNLQTGPADLKPALLVDANHHAGEVTGAAACMAFVQYLIAGWGSDPEVTAILDGFTVYAIPRVSPDGAEHYLTTPHFLRSAPRPYPVPWHGRGLRPADIDGNGLILSMRWPDPAGEWRVSDADGRLMVPLAPAGHQGQRYRLYMEGLLDRDADVLGAADPRDRLDFNRNYPGSWAPDGVQQGSGPQPLSEPETRAVADFVVAHPNIALAVSLHTYGGFILRPPCTEPDDSLPREDLELLLELGRVGEQAGYPLLSIYDDMALDPGRPPRGSFIDFLYGVCGIVGFAPELWSLRQQAGLEFSYPAQLFRQSAADLEREGLQILSWIDAELQGQGWFDWQPFQHPQLGPVEIGGLDLKWLVQNPPQELLAAETSRIGEFLRVMAQSLPRVVVRDATVTPHGGGVYSVQVEVANAGFLPTSGSERGRQLEVADPIRLGLALPPGARLLAGERQQDLGHLPGGHVGGGLTGGWSQGRPVARARWVVKLAEPGPLDLTLTSGRAGHAVFTLQADGGDASPAPR